VITKAQPALVFTIEAGWLAIPGALRINTVYRSLYLMPNANASGRACWRGGFAGRH
jgi:hypothetical protein